MGTRAPQDYKLSAQLIGHQDDVRGVCVCDESKIATASRDRTLRVWKRQEQSHNFELANTLEGHRSFAGPVMWYPPNDTIPEGALVSGGMDTLVFVWTLDPLVLKGHDLQVTSLAAGKDGEIYSASIDSTIRRWQIHGKCDILRGHTAPVQAVIILPDGTLVTGSSDMKIKFWKGLHPTKTINAHTDTVRGLALMPNVGFLSASHDCTVKLWSFSGEQLLEMVGHTAIVYSVAGHASGDIASGSEDGYAKIWRNGTCIQSLGHPGCVWDLKFLPNGDLVTACSDGTARVWTTDPSRYASPEEIANFEETVRQRNLEKKTIGGVKVSDLPGIEALQQPGRSDGQNKVVREGDTAVAYCWNAKEYRWDKIGEVVEGPENSPGQSFNGVEYDYVFDVDIGDGMPTRKLPYNRGENPYTVADKWLFTENLQSHYKQQIVDFILQNTGQQQQLDECIYDPYTGGSAYVPRSTQPQMNRPAKSPTHTLKHIPPKTTLLFDSNERFEKIIKALMDFNDLVEPRLSAEELDKVKEMARVKNSSRIFDGSDFEILTGKLLFWPIANLIPVLDALRLIILHPQAAKYFSERDVLMDLVNSVVTPEAPNGVIFLAEHVIVNCFKYEFFHKWLSTHRSEILDLFSGIRASTNKHVRLAYVTLLLHYAMRMIAEKDESGQLQVLSAAMEIGGEEEKDNEIRFFAFVAIGSLVHSGLMRSVAADLDVKEIAENAKKSKDVKLTEVADDLLYLLK